MSENSAIIAEANNEVYIKEKNEDFMTLLSQWVKRSEFTFK
jgi:hypothetical protein